METPSMLGCMSGWSSEFRAGGASKFEDGI